MPPSPTNPTVLGNLDMDRLRQQNDAAIAEIKGYEIKFILNTDKILNLDSSHNPLQWSSIRFGEHKEEAKLPKDKRGVYAFVISHLRDFLPQHGYIMYIGIAGRDSNRSLYARYKDYLTQSEVERRPSIRNMIMQWHSLLRFHFATVGNDVPPAELKALEKRLITAFLPPCCKDDIEADTAKMVAAFKT